MSPMRTNLLRIAILLIIFNLSFIITRAQFVPIPDPGFVTWLNGNGYAACMNGNLMDTTCPAILNATQIDCSNSDVRDLTGITYFYNLLNLSCAHDSLTFLPDLPPNLLSLACGFNELSYLPDLPDFLAVLHCYNNPHLTSLPQLPNFLLSLNCNYDSLTSLPLLPNTLNVLDCGNNHLVFLPALPDSLLTLSCDFNQLSSIPSLPASFQYLICSNNPLSSGLPALPNTMNTLVCISCQLPSLPILPSSLLTLSCSSNLIVSLPLLPPSLTDLSVSVNPIVNLPQLPNSLRVLDCGSTQTTVLPALPASLQRLSCEGNPLSTLPPLPDSLTYLYASFCNFTSLPEFPDSLSSCWIANNPNLHCLPRLNRIVSLDFIGCGITCLPNYGHVTSSNPALNTLPLCDGNNLNGCSTYWNISGRAYYDVNSNCVKDGSDTATRNIKVMLRSGGNLVGQAYTGGDGFYSFDNDTSGIYEVSADTSNIPFYVTCPANNLYTDTISTLDSFKYNNDFALRCKLGLDLAAHSVNGFPFRQASVTAVQIQAGDLSNFYGAHCAVGVSGTVIVNITGPAKYIAPLGGALSPSTVSGNLLTYNVADFGSVNFFTDFGIAVQTDTTAQIGQQICFNVSVTPANGDNNPANNSLTFCTNVFGSFDPNEKEVYPAGNTDTATKWLTYTIHFQNTGNAEAQNIHVDDTLDVNLDASTLELLAYSFQPKLSIKDRAVRFNFIGINLPDSTTNEPASKGYVQYRIRLKDNLPLGTHISNTAFIYFDFNPAVVTNTTSNTISTTVTGVTDLGFRNADFGLSPNPSNNSITVNMDESMIGSNLTITDITGREVLHSAVLIRNPQFAIRNLSAGVYFVTLENEHGKATKKLVKQ